MSDTASAATRQWIKSYPDGIEWDTDIDTTPVHEQFLATCAKMGDATALDFLGATTSFRALGAKVNALAGALQKDMGIKKGDRVALLLPNTPHFVIAYFAVLRIGATVVNCNPLYSTGELSHIGGAGTPTVRDRKRVLRRQRSSRARQAEALGHPFVLDQPGG